MLDVITRKELLEALAKVADDAQRRADPYMREAEYATLRAKATLCQELIAALAPAQLRPALPAQACDCPPDDVARGIHYNECSPDRPWKRRAPRPDKWIAKPACTCGTTTPCPVLGHS